MATSSDGPRVFPAEILAFNMARVDEDEAAALPFAHTVWRDEGPPIGVILVNGEALIEGHVIGLTTHIARHDPARALRQVAAGRRILARHHDDGNGYCAGCPNGEISGDPEWEIDECPENRDLAATWADNPGYQQRWAS